MSGFDVIMGLILLASCLFGFMRGATREVTTVVSFIVAAGGAVFGLRFTGPFARLFIHSGWLADVAAVIGLFLILYVALRLWAGAMVRGVRLTPLSSLDRLLGFAVGFVRGWVAVGVVMLLIYSVVDPAKPPDWIKNAKLYGLANSGATVLRALAPAGAEVAGAVGHAVKSDGSNSGEGTP